MTDATATRQGQLIDVTVIGQEADEKTVTLNRHQHVAQLLHEGLRALYGAPLPNPDEYDVGLGGKILEPLSRTLADAGVGQGTVVSILPKSISRGAPCRSTAS